MNMFERPTLVKLCGLASAFAGFPLAAQTTIPADAWQFEITPYFWASAVGADVNTRFVGTQHLHVPFSDLASHLDFGAMGTFEARKGRWGGLIDAQYVKLGTSKQPLFAPFSSLDMGYEQQIWTLAAYYRVLEGPVQVDVLGGARYLYAKTNVGLSSIFAPVGLHHAESKGWWDGVVGTRVLYSVNDKWSLLGYADVGGGGSNLSWQVIAGANYLYSRTTTFRFGYRYFSFDRNDAPVSKVSLSGPYIGVGFKF